MPETRDDDMMMAEVDPVLVVPMLPRSSPLDLRRRGVARLLMRVFGRLAALNLPRPSAPIRRQVVRIASHDGTSIKLRLHRPANLSARSPALLWIHGGGYVMGTAGADDRVCELYAAGADLLVVAVDYRLAPEHPYPTPLEDCYAALTWLHANADRLGVDPSRLAVGGASAGAGLAAALAMLARDRQGPGVAFQLLNYPMLDDRTQAQPGRGEWVWGIEANRAAWAAYLGAEPADRALVPGRATRLTGLPPAWVGCGDLDLFHEECELFVRGLQNAGVACDWVSVPGAYHGFDISAPRAEVSKTYLTGQLRALRTALGRSDHPSAFQ